MCDEPRVTTVCMPRDFAACRLASDELDHPMNTAADSCASSRDTQWSNHTALRYSAYREPIGTRLPTRIGNSVQTLVRTRESVTSSRSSRRTRRDTSRSFFE